MVDNNDDMIINTTIINLDIDQFSIYSIIKTCLSSDLNPIIVFTSSGRQCEKLAMNLNHVNFNNGK